MDFRRTLQRRAVLAFRVMVPKIREHLGVASLRPETPLANPLNLIRLVPAEGAGRDINILFDLFV
jgi:hypothetical protein